MPLLGCFGIGSWADRATEDGVEGTESRILIGQIEMTKQNWKRIFVPDKNCAR
jgi:hypothetical protein